MDAATDHRRARAADGVPTPLTGIERARVMLRVAMLLGAVLVFVPLHYLFRLFRLPSPWPRRFLGTAARIAGARVRKVGTHLRRDVFYVSNHVSWIDILALGGASGTAFVAKAEIAAAPVVGWLAGLNRTVYVKRENRLGVAEQINQLRDALADNWAITVFPEGTTTDGKSLLPFKTPMLRVLEPPPPGVLVQPVLVDYGAVGEEIGWIGQERGIDNAKRVLARRGSFELRIHFLEPFRPEDFPGRKAIAAESRRRIEAALIATLGHELRPFRYAEEASMRHAELVSASNEEPQEARSAIPSAGARSFHSGFCSSIRLSFQSRCQFLICFSRAIAASIVSHISK